MLKKTVAILLSCVMLSVCLSAAFAEAGEVIQCDIVVIGGGISGLMAAVAASDAGANVVLVEKQAVFGGSAAYSSGFMTTVNNDNFGEDVDDSLEHTLEVLMGSHNESPDKTYPDIEALTAILNETGVTIDFMLAHGMTAEFTAKSTATTAWSGKGAGMMANLVSIAQNQGVTLMTETRATEILMQDGAAVGIKAVQGDQEIIINAQKVIVCAGGAANNWEMLIEAMPSIENVPLVIDASPGDTGDGYAMMKAIGAKFYDGMRVMEGGIKTKASLNVRLATTGLSFDAEGNRYTNESPRTNQMLTFYMIEDGSSAYYWLYDTSDEAVAAALAEGLDSGEVFYGETIEALAEALSIDPTALRTTFDRYQELAIAGEDTDFGKSSDKLTIYADGGYYAVKEYPVSWGTLGGVVTDNVGHVYAQNDEIIPNLFAAGEMTNRKFFSDFYVGGNSLTTSATLGRLAGQTAAQEADFTPMERKNPIEAETDEADAPMEGTVYVTEVATDRGIIKVQTVIAADGTIVAIEVLEHSETPGLGTVAIEKMLPAMVAGNTAHVDTVSGATQTSNALVEAVQAALDAAQ